LDLSDGVSAEGLGVAIFAKVQCVENCCRWRMLLRRGKG
jgi:hypothetical protein